jgi:predicted MFS family arabinose efflux permease
VLVTGGLSAAVFGITQANDWGWSSSRTIGVLAAAAVLLVGFVIRETRTTHPLMSFSIFRIKTVAGANIAGFILGTALFSMFLMLTLYMQQVLGYSPLKTGVAYIAVAGTSIVWAMVAQQLVTRVGVKPVLVTGMSLLTVGLLYFTQVSVEGSYLGDLLPGFLVIAIGMAFSFVSISIAALAGIQAKDAGLASGLINTSQQIGGALGIAVLSSVAVAHTTDAAKAGDAVPQALTSGFQAAFWVGAGVAFVGVIASLVLIRKDELAVAPSFETEAEALAEAA